MAIYRVHANGRWVRYATLEEAKRVCQEVFEKTGIVLTIEAEEETAKRENDGYVPDWASKLPL